ncbi:MAG: bifunctional precorrin-2 dehydrogenase/sirohydrochlorin ferrochelatase [Nitrospirae bacterium]|nr:MAG: bifunctional precorrin-2 dehydrogenase/sirohydrochlorin ferrochelatase [Nitrospirota bacterium]TLY42188.1 MAG: bifunctional precorrin-2 dehydrogenase/sirohydrochlorin ferrochelatase [Nitrospirota bacterium]
MSANPGLQISLDVKGRSCLVLGGDDEAAEKVQRLLEAGAKVTVVSPTLNDALRKLTASAKVLHRGRLFRAADAEGVVLVINTFRGNPDFSKSLYELAQRERFLLCSTDQPETSTVMMPALVSRGHLRLAISTSGVAPALASRLREDLEQVFDDKVASFLEWLATIRDETKATEPDAEQRRALLRDAVNGFRLTGKVEYPKAWLDKRQQT